MSSNLRMSLYMGLVITAAFVGWAIYHTFLKRDIKEHMNDLYVGILFISAWGIIYWFLLN